MNQYCLWSTTLLYRSVSCIGNTWCQDSGSASSCQLKSVGMLHLCTRQMSCNQPRRRKRGKPRPRDQHLPLTAHHIARLMGWMEPSNAEEKDAEHAARIYHLCFGRELVFDYFKSMAAEMLETLIYLTISLRGGLDPRYDGVDPNREPHPRSLGLHFLSAFQSMWLELVDQAFPPHYSEYGCRYTKQYYILFRPL